MLALPSFDEQSVDFTTSSSSSRGSEISICDRDSKVVMIHPASIHYSCAIVQSFIEAVGDDDGQRLGDEVDLQPLPKRRKRPRVSEFPRILKTDMRRYLATMFCNVMNSADSRFISSFFRQVCVSSCRSVDYSCCPSLPRKVPIKFLDGLDAIIDRLCEDLHAIPDFALSIKESFTQHRLDQPGSKVVMKVQVKGTKVFQPRFTFMNGSDYSVLSIPPQAYDALVASGKIRHDPYVTPPPMGNVPFPVDVYGTVSFLLDNNHRIYRMEYEGNIQLPLLHIQ